jgi:TetR/AcrR family transcriptional regulator, regulator of biofilm formation and stress response
MTPEAEVESAAGGYRSRQRAARRGAIIDAAVKIIATRGLNAVTHRAVAREAKVPLAATTYYFASKDEILREALESLSSAEVERLNRLAEEIDKLKPEQTGVALASALIGDSEDGRRGWLAQFEIYLEAARQPALRPAIEQRRAAFVALAEVTLRRAGAPDPEKRAEIAVAGINGILLDRVRELGDNPHEAMLDHLRQFFAMLING